MCLDAQGGIKAKRQSFFVVLRVWSCQCLVVIFQTKSTCFHCIAFVRVSCQTTTLDSLSLECENTYTFKYGNIENLESMVQDQPLRDVEQPFELFAVGVPVRKPVLIVIWPMKN